MAHQLEISRDAENELKGLKKRDRNKVLDEMDKQLLEQPSVSTKNRKCLGKVEAGFEYEPPFGNCE